MTKFFLRENQYRPAKPKINPKSGLALFETYYYFVNEKEQVVDFKTLKPYKGKQMNRYAMHSKAQAEAYLEVINKQHERIFVVKNIKYDTDGVKGLGLPKTIKFIIPDEIDVNDKEAVEQFLSDEISNQTGYCHLGFTIEGE